MIPIFRKIRKKMADDNKPMKYMRYAIGEIVLVVIGILIALQINNWNEERIQKQELNDILQSIANGVQSDIRELKLLSVARANIEKKADSIFNNYIDTDKKSINLEEVAFINSVFRDILNTIHFSSNLSAFESLKNSTYIGKIQGSDLALLLSTYYSSGDKMRNLEDRYNQSLENLEQSWSANFRNNGENIFTRPWLLDDFASVAPRYLDILRDNLTKDILENGYGEGDALPLYRDQILMGNKLIEMLRNSETTFDQQTKLDFSGILFSFADADLISILINGEVPTGFDLRYASSGENDYYFSKEIDYLVIEYPEKTYDWASPFFIVNALNGRVNEMDFSSYSKLYIEMKGETGDEAFEITMKDKNDPPDGTESRITLELTDEWKIYEIETNKFVTADMKTIMVPLAIVFKGPIGEKIYVRSIQFRKD